VQVDQQTFLVLGWQQHAADGALISSYAVEGISYDAPLPSSATPPVRARAAIRRASRNARNAWRNRQRRRRGW